MQTVVCRPDHQSLSVVPRQPLILLPARDVNMSALSSMVGATPSTSRGPRPILPRTSPQLPPPEASAKEGHMPNNRLQIADVKNDITGMEKVWKDMNEDYMYTKNIAMGVLDRLDFQFADVKRAVEELKREAKRIERFLKNRSRN